MRFALTVSLVAFYAGASFAQGVPQQQASLPQQYSDNYNPAIPVYNQPQYVPAHPQPAPTHVVPQVQPWDYGQSIKTDIRQMNF